MRISPIKRILIVTPKDQGEASEYAFSGRENLGVEYLLSALRAAGHLAESINENLPGEPRVDEVDLSAYDVVGFSLPFWEDRMRYVNLINELRFESTTFIIAGGHAATIGAEYFLQKCPKLAGIVMGEGETTIVELLTSKNINPSVPGFYNRKGFKKRILGNINSLAFPDRDELRRSINSGMSFDEAYIASTRGCTNRCNFCSIPIYYHLAHNSRWRERSTSNVCQEIDEILDLFPQVQALSFTDDNFFGYGLEHKKRGIGIARHIYSKRRNLSFEITCRADSVDYNTFEQLVSYGLSGVYLGIESGVQRILDLFNKGTTVEQNLKSIEVLSQLGIGCDVGFIMFSCTITVDEFRENLLFLRHILENYPIYVQPACVFRSLRDYPDDLGQAALVEDSQYQAPRDDLVNALRISLEAVWRDNYEKRFLQLEQLAISGNRENNSSVQDLRVITLDMIDIGLEMINEAQKCQNAADRWSLAQNIPNEMRIVE